MKKLISVVIPVFNIKCYFEKCINSICAQTYECLEIILVDDGSTDSSGDICDNYAKNDTRIKVLHKENEGLVKARKDGLKASSGQYIVYVDGDDWIEPNMVETLYSTIESENVDVVMSGWYEDTGNVSKPATHGIKSGKYNKDRLLNEIYPNMIVNEGFFEWGIFPSVWAKMFRRECLEPFQIEVDDNLTMGEDAACIYPCLLNANSICVLDECLYHYRQTPNSMVKKVEKKVLERKRIKILYATVKTYFEKNTSVYNLCEQWKEFLLFLMVPRADSLYEGIEQLEYLFPFPNVKKGSNIVIYGMGTYGQRLNNYLRQTGFCNVLMCADRNYEELSKQGLDVKAPEEISNYNYDAIVIACSFAKTRAAIYNELSGKYPAEKIHVMDENLVKSQETIRAFGLL